jgi:hypothetical protein
LGGLAGFGALAGAGGPSDSNASTEPYDSGGTAYVDDSGGAASATGSTTSSEELIDRAIGVVSVRPVAAE